MKDENNEIFSEEKNLISEREKNENEKQPRRTAFFREIVTFAILTLLIVIPIRVYVAQPYIVSGGSMDPTFTNRDYLIVDQISYRFNTPERGDIIVFHFPLELSKFFIKRIIGLPGETVTINKNGVFITSVSNPDGFTLSEPYLTQENIGETMLSLGKEEYFVMGDNRVASLDSRIWGAVSKEEIVGRVLLRLLPIGEIDYLPGKFIYFKNNQKSDTVE